MSLSETLSKLSPVKGDYYLIESEKVDEFYRNAGYGDDDDVPNFIEIDGKECLFTENFVERDGKEYEIVLVANGFSWDDVMVLKDDEMSE